MSQNKMDCVDVKDYEEIDKDYEEENVHDVNEEADSAIPAIPEKKERLKKSEKKALAKERRREVRKKMRKNDKKKRRVAKGQERNQFFKDMSTEEIQQVYDEERQAKEDVKLHVQAAYIHGAPKIVINCGFHDSMSEIEITSLAKQTSLVWGLLKSQKIPFQFHLTSMYSDNPTIPKIQKFGSDYWKIHYHEKPYWEVFDDVVVLSPDATEELDEVYPDKTYVIGGLVDKTVTSLQTLNEARGKNSVTKIVKLPLRTFGPVGCKTVLNIDTVVKILLARLENVPWEDVLFYELPPRIVAPGMKPNNFNSRLNVESSESSNVKIEQSDVELHQNDEDSPRVVKIDPSDEKLVPSDVEIEQADVEIEPSDEKLIPSDVEIEQADEKLIPSDVEIEQADDDLC